MKRLHLAALAAASMFVLQACAATCDDACNALVDCAKKFDPNDPAEVSGCVADCEARRLCGPGADEAKHQAAVECLEAIECDAERSANAEIVACFLRCA